MASAARAARAAKPAGPIACYRVTAPVACFLAAAKLKLAQVSGVDARADAVGELLYALAGTSRKDDAIIAEAMSLAANSALKPVKQMNLLYAIDLYRSGPESSSDQSYWTALARFSELEGKLEGAALIDLYIDACGIIGWDEPFRDRWFEFAQTVCSPARLLALKPEGVAQQSLIIAMMPVAMTFADNRSGFAQAAGRALSWLSSAERLVAKSTNGSDKDFVAFMAILMHTMNALCLDAFDMEEAAAGSADLAMQALRRHEKRVGTAGAAMLLRRQVAESLFNTGRERLAKNLLRQMLAAIAGDAKSKRISYGEQVAILSLAARLEYDEQTGAETEGTVLEGTMAI